MVKYVIFAALFFVLMALNAAGFMYIVRDLGGTTVTSKPGGVPPPVP